MKRLLFIFLGLHLVILSMVRFTAWPEMLSYPYLFSNGFKLYTDFVYPYPPLLTLLLAGFYKVFSFKIFTLKIASWLFILGSDIFLFLMVRKLLKKEFLTFLFLLPYLLIQSFLDGNMLWFDNALTFPVAAGIYFLTEWLDKKNLKDLVFTSFFFTVAAFIKQTGIIYFAAFLIFYFWIRRKLVWEELKNIFLFPVLAGGIFLVYLFAAGSFRDFWLWNLYYPLTFWSKFPGYRDLNLNFQEKTVLVMTLFPFLGGLLVKTKILKDRIFFLILGFLASSVIAVYPRFSYFHLQPFFVLLFIGYALIFKYLKQVWYIGMIGLISLLVVYPTFSYSFTKSERFYDENDQKVIKIVSALSTKEEKVSLIGLYSSIYVFADRFPPKPWADNFGWYFEIPGWQEYTIRKFEEDPPVKIFYKLSGKGNWFDLGVYRPKKLVDYIHEHYYRDSEPIAGVELWRRIK